MSKKETSNVERAIEDGIYIFYVKDEVIFPVVMNKDNWEMLQMMGNAINGGEPLQVINSPMGMAKRWEKDSPEGE